MSSIILSPLCGDETDWSHIWLLFKDFIGDELLKFMIEGFGSKKFINIQCEIQTR